MKPSLTERDLNPEQKVEKGLPVTFNWDPQPLPKPVAELRVEGLTCAIAIKQILESLAR